MELEKTHCRHWWVFKVLEFEREEKLRKSVNEADHILCQDDTAGVGAPSGGFQYRFEAHKRRVWICSTQLRTFPGLAIPPIRRHVPF